MVAIHQMLVSSRAKCYSGVNPCNYIVIHETANTSKGADAEMHARLQRNGFSASWHYTVDDKGAWQSYPDSVQCWHAGDGHGIGNTQGIGIEICVNSDGNFAKAVDNAAELVRHLMAKHNIPISNVIQHHVRSSFGKDCPHYLRCGSKGPTWASFIAAVQAGGGHVDYKPQTNAEHVTTKPTAPASNLIRKGDKGAKVKALQKRLIALGYALPKYGADGSFGAETDAAVRKFQRDHGLAVDGIVGPNTQKALDHAKAPAKPKASASLPTGILRQGAKGPSVKAVQKALASVYFYPDKGAKNNGIDGIYGPKTADAVRRFQSMHGLAQDGVYGPKTRAALLKAMK